MNLLFSRNVKFLHRTRPRNLYVGFDLFIYATDHVFKNVLVGEPEIEKEQQGHGQKPGDHTGKVPCQIHSGYILIVFLKTYDLKDIAPQEKHGNYAVVDGKLGKRARQCAHKSKSMTIVDITGDMKSSGKCGHTKPNDKKAGKIYFVEIF